MPRPAFIAAPLAILATASAVSLGLLGAEPQAATSYLAADSSSPSASAATDDSVPQRSAAVSRSGKRFEKKPTKFELTMAPKAVQKAIRNADTKRWTDGELNLWVSPAKSAKKRGVIGEGKKVLVTGRAMMGREEIVVDGKARWVTAGYLVDEKPAALGGSCTNGSSVPGGVRPGIVAIHRAVCANWPQVTRYGTFRGGGGDHGSGRAVDIMIAGSTGWQIAEFVRAHASEFNVSYVIYSQRIWSTDRAGEGWRAMSDRGSATANHYDHVHVSVY